MTGPAASTAQFAVELAVVVLSLVLFGLFLHWFLRWETRLRRY